jgi:hypothetical protein
VLIFYVLLFGVVYLALCDFRQLTRSSRVSVSARNFATASDDASLMSRVITGDESWIYGYDLETKQESSQWKTKSKVRKMLISLFDIKRIVHKIFVLEVQTVNSSYYSDILRLLCENVRRLRPELWWQKYWLLHHDTALSHTSSFTKDFFLPKTTLLSSLTHLTFLCFSECR